MKKLNSTLFGVIAAVALTGAVQAQTVIYTENFESTALNAMPANMKIINKDNQTLTNFGTLLPNNVAWAVQNGTTVGGSYSNMALTSSYFTNTSVQANRWVITPQITLTAPATGTNLILKWDAITFKSAPNYEVYDVLVSTTDTALASFTNVVASITNEATGGNLNTRSVNLNSFSGKNVYIAFHYKSTNGYFFCIDNLSVATVLANDAALNSIIVPPYVQKGTSFNVSGMLSNQGSTQLNNVDINWSVNGGTTNSQTLSSLALAPYSTATFTHSTAVTNPISGSNTIKVWVSNPNSSVDGMHNNDTLTASYVVLDTLFNKKVLIEEFNQASCDPCAEATPHLDAVLDSTRTLMQNTIRYHVNFPGRDFINEQTQVQVGPRITYYGVQGVPDGKIDGATDFYPGSITSNDIQSAYLLGSPIQLSASYQISGATHTITAAIKSQMALPAGIRAYAAIIDSLHFNANQSTESIPQYDFPQAVEQLLPSVTGSALTAFTAGQTQNVTFTWGQTHRLATQNASFPYDSGHFQVVVFIQNYTSKYVYQSLQINANSSASNTVGIANNASVVQAENTLAVYPNPFTQNLNIALNLNTECNVKIEVFNMLGQKVYETNKGTLGLGKQQFEWNASSLENGIYMIKATTGNKSITQKVTLLK